MTKKVNVTLPDGVYEELDREANTQGRSPANLAAFIIEHHLLMYRGLPRLESQRTSQSISSSGVEMPDQSDVLIQFLKSAASGKKPEADILLGAAQMTGLSPDILLEMSTKVSS